MGVTQNEGYFKMAKWQCGAVKHYKTTWQVTDITTTCQWHKRECHIWKTFKCVDLERKRRSSCRDCCLTASVENIQTFSFMHVKA